MTTILQQAQDRLAEIHPEPFKTREAYAEAVARQLAHMGHYYIKAEYDNAGNCVICGEAGRCPGVHVVGEVIA